jgi:YD repeat-containing protein
VQINKPGSSPITSFYNREGRLVRTETIGFNNQISSESYTYNTRGDVVSKTITGATGQPITSHFSYNYDLPFSRLSQVTDPLGTTSFQYQYGQGNATINTTRNHAGWSHPETTTQITDPTGKIIHTTDQGGTLNFSFDSWGNIIRTRLDVAIIQTKKANAYGQIEELWDANSGTIKFEYNAFGELTKQTDAKNNVTDFTYDRLGRIKTRTINTTDQTTFNYVVSGNGRGNVAQILRPAYNTTETYTYDAHGRPTTHRRKITIFRSANQSLGAIHPVYYEQRCQYLQYHQQYHL